MHRALLVEEALAAGEGEDAFVPDVRMDVEALRAGEAKADEALRRDVVAGQRQRHVERPLIERKEQLAAIGVVVGVPQDHAPRRIGVIGARDFRRFAVAEDVVAADGFVAAVEDVALPFAHEHALGRAALVAGVGVDRTAAACRPANDLDPARRGIVDQAPIAEQALGRGVDDRHSHALQARGQLGVKVVDRRRRAPAIAHHDPTPRAIRLAHSAIASSRISSKRSMTMIRRCSVSETTGARPCFVRAPHLMKRIVG